MMLLLLAAPVQLQGSRRASLARDDDEAPTAPSSMLGDGAGIDLVNDGGDEEGTTIFVGNEESQTVEDKRSENPDSDVQKVMEIRTKLKFNSNKKTLANPELVEKILEDIKEQQETMPGFMEGRVESFKDALQPDGTMPGVSGVIEDEFMHFETTRFADLIMWAYGGDKAPECAQSDLTPPAP